MPLLEVLGMKMTSLSALLTRISESHFLSSLEKKMDLEILPWQQLLIIKLILYFPKEIKPAKSAIRDSSLGKVTMITVPLEA